MDNAELSATINRWVSNARIRIERTQDELHSHDVTAPNTLAARMADDFAKIEAWSEVLRVLSKGA